MTAAGRQAGEVLRSRDATTSQKREAVKVLGQAVAGEVGKKVAEHTAREAKKAFQKPEVRSALKTAVKALPLAAGIGVALSAAALAAGVVGLTHNQVKQATDFANRELEKTSKRVKDLTPDQARTLWQQYYDYAVRRAPTNSFVGK